MLGAGVKVKAELEHAKLDDQRIWVVSELYYPELTSTGYFLTGIAEGLAESGGHRG